LLEPPALIEAIEQGVRELEAGSTINPRETRIDVASPRSNFTTFPALATRRGVFSVKILSASDARIARGLPLIEALVVAVDAESGNPLAIMGARHLTAARTAATTAVALKHLAPGRGGTLGIVGTGIQARLHLDMLPLVRRFDHMLVASPSGAGDRAEALAAAARHRWGVPTEVAGVRETVRAADFLVTATNRREPLAEESDFDASRFIAVIGSMRPGACEIPIEMLADANVVADWPERFCAHWTGRGLSADFLAAVRPLGQMLDVEPAVGGRRSVFLSGGMAFEDGVAAELLLRRALAEGRGTVLA
jgi:ornithine cyclodeaminase/alanine dehydrogenase-like protein (mu-crystallin family)